MISQQTEVRRNPQHWNVSLVNTLDVFTCVCIHAPQCVAVPVPAWLNVPGSSEVTCITFYDVFFFNSKIHALIAYILQWHEEKKSKCACGSVNADVRVKWTSVWFDGLLKVIISTVFVHCCQEAHTHQKIKKKQKKTYLHLMNFTLWWLCAGLVFYFFIYIESTCLNSTVFMISTSPDAHVDLVLCTFSRT